MAVLNDTNILFVPYRPSYSSKPLSADISMISQQKHAAREYHRKAKLQRTARRAGTTHKRQPHASIDIYVDPSNNPSRPFQPRKNTFPDRTVSTQYHIIRDVGSGQLDPFHVCVPEGIPNYVLEMLDHGKSSRLHGLSPRLRAQLKTPVTMKQLYTSND